MLSLVEGLKSVALLSGGLFVGSAVYITVVEAPSRRELPIEAKLEQWRRSFHNGARYVLCLGTASASSSIVLYFCDGANDSRNLWLVTPCCFLIGGIYSAAIMLPEIKILQDEKVIDKKGEKWVDDAIERWSLKHIVRDILNIGSFVSTIYACLKSH